MNVLIVGAGFAGCVVAERLASAGHSVLIIEKRDHLGGNAYDEYDSHGVLVHRYGPHIFHTNSQAVFEYLSRFTDWRFYEHRVLSRVDGKYFHFPINLDTLNKLYGFSFDEQAAQEYLEKVRLHLSLIRNSQEAVWASVGCDLSDKFYKNYTRKQWGLELSELNAGVAGRIPVRTNHDDRYFTDSYQFMPKDGYTALFERLIYNERITVDFGLDFFERRNKIKVELVVYTGPLDAYFNYSLGVLPYRSLRFEHEHIENAEHFLTVGTVNFPNDFNFTRITEFKHLTGQEHSGTSIVREYPKAEGEPYYPIPTAANEALAAQYRQLAAKEKDVIFIGRLAQYKYLNMDQVIAAALKVTA